MWGWSPHFECALLGFVLTRIDWVSFEKLIYLKIMDIKRSETFVAENGSELEIARMHFVLYGKNPEPDVLERFTVLQNQDGGFPCGLTKDNPSSLDRTHLALWWLDELGRLESPEVDRGIDYIIRRQNVDGSWDEDPSLIRRELPPWIIPGDLLTQLYLTAYSVYWLGVSGHRRQSGFQRALDFLMEYQDERGEFHGYLHTTWLATSAYIMADGQNSVPAQKGMQALMARPLSEYEASQLAWLLNCLNAAGLSRGHHVARHFLIYLRQLRREDGSWASEDGDIHAVDSTIESLRALKRFGYLSK